MGFSPTILGLPTYPDPSFGLVARQRLGEHLQLRAGVFDGAAQEGYSTGSLGPATLFGAPDDLFLIGELDGRWRGGRVGLGAWQHTGTFERFDGGQEDGTQGLYAVADQRLIGETGEDADPGGLDAFGQLGLADPDVSLFELHVGAGLAWRHPFAPARNDELGLGLSWVELSDAPGASHGEEREVAFELFYAFEPIPWVRLQPDVQYILNPGGDPTLDDALLLTLRVSASL
jgi:porin